MFGVAVADDDDGDDDDEGTLRRKVAIATNDAAASESREIETKTKVKTMMKRTNDETTFDGQQNHRETKTKKADSEHVRLRHIWKANVYLYTRWASESL